MKLIIRLYVTITAYTKNTLGAVTNLKGNFDFVATISGLDIEMKEGNFNVSIK